MEVKTQLVLLARYSYGVNETTEYQSAQQTAHTPLHNMLPLLHTIYNDVILLNVLTEV